MVKRIISAYQLAGILFLSKILGIILHIPLYGKGIPIVTLAVNELLSIAIGAAVIVPSILLHKREEKSEVKTPFGWVGVLYSILFVFYLGLVFYDFNKLFSGIIFQGEAALFLIITMFTVVIYAAKCGLESLARSSSVIIFLFLLSFLFILISSAKDINYKNMINQFNLDFEFKLQPFFGSTEYVMFALLSKYSKGDAKKGGLLFLILSAIISFLAVFTVTAILGDFAGYQTIPYFLLASISEISIFTRLESIQGAIFAFMFALKLSLLLLCAYLPVKSYFENKYYKNIIFYIISAVSVLISLFMCYVKGFYDFCAYTVGSIYITVIFAFVIPLCALAVFYIKRRRGGEG